VSSNASVDRIRTARWQQWPLWIGVVLLSVCFISARAQPVHFLRAYLASYLFFLGIGLGSMVLLMVYHLTGGSWGFVVRRILEAGMKTLPMLAIFFLPIALGIRYLYAWADPDIVAASPKLQYQQFYLAPTYFWIRAAVYFVLWTTMAFVLASWSRREDETGNPRLAWKSRQLSAAGAVVYGISLHFAAIDWGMSLQTSFHSTIWGPLFASGQLLSGLAFALIVLACAANRPAVAEVMSIKVRYDLASLLFTLLILWAYMAWFQFMLIWIANMQVDVIWYLPRSNTIWLLMIWAIVVLHFALPFFLLLMRPIKRNSAAVAWIAGLILIMQLAFNYYQVIPEVTAPALKEQWVDFVVPLGMGGIWLAFFAMQLGQNPLLPLHDYNRAAALHLRHLDVEEAIRQEAVFHG
jgi:hypothetical protein